MGGIGHVFSSIWHGATSAVRGVVGGVGKVVGGLLGGGQPQVVVQQAPAPVQQAPVAPQVFRPQTTYTPPPPTPAVAAAVPQQAAQAAAVTPETNPTELKAANDTSRKKRGKAALTIPSSNINSGSGGTGLNI